MNTYAYIKHKTEPGAAFFGKLERHEIARNADTLTVKFIHQ